MSASARFVVVGGGVVAAAVAYHLACWGAAVVVVEGAQAGTATNAGAGIICPWTAPLDDACYRLCCEGARHYPALLAMLADDGEAETGYARVATLCVAEAAGAPHEIAALLRSRRPEAPDMGELTVLAPGEPARLFPPLAPGLGGLWISVLAHHLVARLSDPIAARAMRGLVAEVHEDAALTRRFTSAFLARERACLAVVLDRAVARGELVDRPDLAWAHALLVGPVFALLLVFGDQPPPGLGDRVAAGVVAALGVNIEDGSFRSIKEAS